jgi:hypothetical protein
MILDQTNNDLFSWYNNDYSATSLSDWNYPADVGSLHKFDTLLDGSVAFVSINDDSPWAPPTVEDPSHALFRGNFTSNGALTDGFFHFFGDQGVSPDPDPELLPWWWTVDFSSGIPGGISDTQGYFFFTFSNKVGNPVAHDGRMALIWWDAPYDNSGVGGSYIPGSMQGGGTGGMDDTQPGTMALAVDDNNQLAIDLEPTITYWILDSAGSVQANVLDFAAAPTVIFMDPPLTSTEYGGSTPVDITIANAVDNGLEVTNFNWLVVLLDNGDDTWSVGIWEYDYIATPDLAEWIEIGITDPLPGTPLSVDFDVEEFEIHVLADNGGTIEATVFDYVD